MSVRQARSQPRETKIERQRIVERLPLVLFVLGLAYVAFLYGFAAAFYRLPPYGLFRTAYHGFQDLRKHWKNDLNLEPTRLLVAAGSDRARISVSDETKVAEGYKLISGLTHGRDALSGAMLLNRDGKEIHYWPVDYEKIDPEGKDAENVFLHGLEVLPDGSIIVNFDDGNALARIDACGNVIWRLLGRFHHAVSRAYDGTIWTLEHNGPFDELILQLDNNGQVLRRISILDDIAVPNHLQAIFAIRASAGENEIEFDRDAFHLNDIEVLSPHEASRFPLFEPGDLLISLRELNLVAVIDGNHYTVKWSQIGPWYRQHDPDFLDDGTISVFNNDTASGRSEIIVINPQTGRLRTVLKGNKELPFYTWRRGKHQHLENGNILITESEVGRVFEVDGGGDVVWQYQNVFDESRNGLINKAMQLPLDFFEPDALRCQ